MPLPAPADYRPLMGKAEDRLVALWDLQTLILQAYGGHPDVSECYIKDRPGRVVVVLAPQATDELRGAITRQFRSRVEVTKNSPEREMHAG